MLCLAANKQARSASLLTRCRQHGIHANILAGAPMMLSNRLLVGCAGARLLELQECAVGRAHSRSLKTLRGPRRCLTGGASRRARPTRAG